MDIFKKPEVDIVCFDDVILSSNGGGDNTSEATNNDGYGPLF